MHLACLTIAMWMALSGTAYAYIDPGTGSILLQAVVAVIATVMGVLSLWWKKIKAFFSGKKSKDPR